LGGTSLSTENKSFENRRRKELQEKPRRIADMAGKNNNYRFLLSSNTSSA
jgi:hypothetical protein